MSGAGPPPVPMGLVSPEMGYYNSIPFAQSMGFPPDRLNGNYAPPSNGHPTTSAVSPLLPPCGCCHDLTPSASGAPAYSHYASSLPNSRHAATQSSSFPEITMENFTSSTTTSFSTFVSAPLKGRQGKRGPKAASSSTANGWNGNANGKGGRAALGGSRRDWRRPQQEETESSSSDKEEAEHEVAAPAPSTNPNKEKEEAAATPLPIDRGNTDHDPFAVEMRLRRGWERERCDMAWRWTWLQLQIAELNRQSRDWEDRLDRKRRSRQRVVPLVGDSDSNGDNAQGLTLNPSSPPSSCLRTMGLVPPTRHRKLSRPRVPNKYKPPPLPQFDDDAPHPLFSSPFPGLYANRRPSQAADQPATPLAATGAVDGAPDLERSSVPVDAAAVAVAAAGKTPAVVAASQQHPKQTDGAKPNSASISKKRRREEREPIEVIDRPPPPKVEPLASRPTPTAGRGKAVDRRPPPVVRAVSSKALAKPQQAAKGPAKKKKRKHSNLRSSDFDINNYVSLGNSTVITTEHLRTESIYTPTWRLLAEDEDPPSAAATGDGSSSEEDTSDETFAFRHFEQELVERRRYLAPKLEKERKQRLRRGRGGAAAATAAPAAVASGLGKSDAAIDHAAKDSTGAASIGGGGGKPQVLPTSARAAGNARAHMSQVISSLAALLPITKSDAVGPPPSSSSTNLTSTTTTLAPTPEPDAAERKQFLKQNFALAKDTYVNDYLINGRSWQPPPRPQPAKAGADGGGGSSDDDDEDDGGGGEFAAMGPGFGSVPSGSGRFAYYEDAGYNVLDDDDEDDDGDDDEDLFTPGAPSASKSAASARKRKKVSGGGARPPNRGKGGGGGKAGGGKGRGKGRGKGVGAQHLLAPPLPPALRRHESGKKQPRGLRQRQRATKASATAIPANDDVVVGDDDGLEYMEVAEEEEEQDAENEITGDEDSDDDDEDLAAVLFDDDDEGDEDDDDGIDELEADYEGLPMGFKWEVVDRQPPTTAQPEAAKPPTESDATIGGDGGPPKPRNVIVIKRTSLVLAST